MKKTVTFKDGTMVDLDTTHEWKNLKVIEMDMPVKGMCCKWGKDSGEYRIFIDSALPDQEKLETFIHEMIHLYRGDLEKQGESVQKIETECHHITQEVLRSIGI